MGTQWAWNNSNNEGYYDWKPYDPNIDAIIE